MEKLSIRDQLFHHAYSTSNWFKPIEFEWDFVNLHNDFVFLTDQNVFQVSDPELKDYRKYAWLVESPVITPKSYQFVAQNPTLFDKIFTHSEELLKHAHAHLVPIGGCHLDQADISLDHTKTKLVSMMYSNKNSVDGHNLRHQIANTPGINQLVDLMGSGVDGRHVKKIESCRDYAFSVVIENCKQGYYFTEKIVDCFLTGTIPIYWGTSYIGQFFNARGFLTFSTADQLIKALGDRERLAEFYNDHHDDVIENFRLAHQYKVGDDYLYKHFRQIL